jgi:hypothetical protein
MTLNPFNDDLGSVWAKSRPEPKKPEKSDPVEHFEDKDEALWLIENLYGPVERLPRPRKDKSA